MFRHVTPPHQSYEELERLYWSYDLIDRSDDPLYGADVPASLIDAERKIWNVGRDEIFNDFGRRLTQVEDGSYLYFGMWKSTFSWHIEDMDLYGVNYLHYGAPKSWYCIPPAHGYKLEMAARELFPDWAEICFNFLRHKICMISPELLARRGVKVNKMVQEERDLIIVFPHAYHAGFNHGFNIAEASNFGTPSWVEHGKRHRPCRCSQADRAVKIDMEPLVEAFQPDRLQSWRAGTDLQPHPDDSREVRNIFAFCKEILEKKVWQIDLTQFDDDAKMFSPKKLKVIENNQIVFQYVDLTEEEKIQRLKQHCQKQIDHFTLYRDITPELKDLLKITGETLTVVEREETKEDTKCSEEREWFSVTKSLLKKSLRVTVSLKKDQSLKDYVAKLPRKSEAPPAKLGQTSSSRVLVRKHGFADVSTEELEAKRSLKKCPTGRHKLWPCRKCSGCLRPDCGACIFCLDKPKFGGDNIRKQKCLHKKCSNPVVRSCENCTWNL